MSPLTAVQPDPLGELAARVREEHRAVQASASSMLQHAIAAGQALTEAKALLIHGQWLPWLAGVGITPRTAQRYMRVAREYDSVSHLPADASMADALDALAKPPPRDKTRQERMRAMSAQFDRIMGARVPSGIGSCCSSWRYERSVESEWRAGGRLPSLASYASSGAGSGCSTSSRRRS
jgi:Protein of unknown function (DUF3102)